MPSSEDYDLDSIPTSLINAQDTALYENKIVARVSTMRYHFFDPELYENKIVDRVSFYLVSVIYFLYTFLLYLPRRMGLLRSDVSLEDDCNHASNFPRVPVRISAPQLLCCNL